MLFNLNEIMLLNLSVASNIILSYLFFFYLIIGLHYSVPAVIAQIFNAITELVIPTGISNKKAKAFG